MNGALVAVRGVGKTFGGIVALDGVDFEVAPGEVHGLVGENGAGKSTLLKVLAGLYEPDAGTIEIDGEEVAKLTPHKVQEHGFAFIHQEVQSVPGLSVAESMHLGTPTPTRLGLIDRRAIRARASEMLGRLEIDVDPAAAMRELTLVQQVGVSIARAVALDARLIVMDEPTASFSPHEVEVLFRVTRRLQAEGRAVVYVSHRLAEIFALCERVTVMRDGRKVCVKPIGRLTHDALVHDIIGNQLLAQAYDLPVPGEPVLTLSALQDERVGPADLVVRRGEIVGLGGLVGSGRSRLIRLIYGAERRTGGSVTVDGHALRAGAPDDAVRRGIGLVPEDRGSSGFVGPMSVRENATLPVLRRFANVLGLVRRGRQRSRVREAGDELKIKMASTEVPVRTLSGGNQQKVVIAKWLIAGAQVLIFDEPTRGIDIGAKEEVFRLIVAAAHEGAAVIVASSELEELVGLCHRVVVMREGQVVGELAQENVTVPEILRLCYVPE